MIALGFIIALGLTFRAAYELQAANERLSVRPRMPKNRDALVAAITIFERAAQRAVKAWRAHNLEAIDVGGKARLSPANLTAFDEAEQKLEIEERIAGEEFALTLMWYRKSVGVCIYAIWHDNLSKDTEWISDDLFEKTENLLRDVTPRILDNLDKGELFSPIG